MTIYDASVRELAASLFERGQGRESAARLLGVPAGAVRKWQLTYRAVGRDGLLGMGGTHNTYDFETKVAAARAVVDGGMTRPEAMARFGVASRPPWTHGAGRTARAGPRPCVRVPGAGLAGPPRPRRARRSSSVRTPG